MNPDKEFEQKMNQLVRLLKDIVSHLPSMGSFPPVSPEDKIPSSSSASGVNLNLCFFTFLPMAPEDFDELEEMYGQHLAHEGSERAEELPPRAKLSPEDLDFLRRHGIRF